MKKKYTLPFFLSFIVTFTFIAQSTVTHAQSGIVFRDFNSNGLWDAGESGVGNIIIRSYRADNSLLATAVSTTATGAYTLLPAATANEPVRIEFSIPTAANGLSGASATLDFSSYGGAQYGSAVQFARGPQAIVNYALNHPADFCQPNPMMAIPCYINGDTQGNGTVGLQDVLVKFPYDAYTTNQNNVRQSFPYPIELAVGKNLGSVWGLAYQRSSQKLVSAALLKRHMSLGPLGLSGLYITDVNSNLTTALVQLDQLSPAFNFGSIDPVSRGIPASGPPYMSHDPDAYKLAGRIGIGGIDFSEDEKTLFAINLYDRKLYSIFLNKPAVAPTAADVASYAIPNPGCGSADDMRPWAVKVYRGKVFVGVVCTAESTQDASQLSATIYAFDPANAGAGFKQVMQFPLTYPRGYTWWGGGGNRWYPWTNNFADLLANPVDGWSAKALPQPILADLEFDEDGSLILGFSDRTGSMLGLHNYSPFPDSTATYSGTSAGDILRTYAVNDTFLLENNAQAGPYLNTAGQGNGTGPGNGEFFNEERLANTFNTLPYQDVHGETALGGLSLKLGSRQVVSVVFDPLIPFSGGLKHFSTTDGSVQNQYQVYEQDPNDAQNAQFGKASGLGDIELFCDEAPLEIGNRVWEDTNGDGIQGANEPGIGGLPLDLFQGNTKVGTTITDSNGHYYFNSDNVVLSGATGLVPATAYTIRVAETLGIGSLSACVSVSPKDTNTLAGSDADLIANTIQISYTTRGHGQNEHGLDIGLLPAPPCQLVVTATPGDCFPATNTYMVSGLISMTVASAGTLTITDGTAQVTAAISSTTTSLAYSLTGINADGGQHTISVLSSATTCSSASTTYTAPASCSVAPALSLSITQGICDLVTGKYNLTGTVSLTNAPAGVLTLKDSTGTSRGYTVASSSLSISAGQTSITFLLSLLSTGSSHTVTISGAGFTNQPSLVYVAPVSCFQPELRINKRVDRAVAQLGDTLTYTIQVINIGQAAAKLISVTETVPAGLSILTTEVTAGTVTAGIWTIDSLRETDTIILRIKGLVIGDGVLINKASIPGDTATACTSVPIRLCKGSDSAVELSAPAGESAYQWFRNGAAIPGATSALYLASLPGSYSVVVNGGITGKCPDQSCCPVLIEADSVRSFLVTAVAATCQGNTMLSNGRLSVSDYKNDPADRTVYTYQYVAGSTFGNTGLTPAAPQPVPADGLLTTTLPASAVAQPYTVRIFNGRDCFTDVVVIVPPTVCICKPTTCIPVVIKRIRTARR